MQLSELPRGTSRDSLTRIWIPFTVVYTACTQVCARARACVVYHCSVSFEVAQSQVSWDVPWSALHVAHLSSKLLTCLDLTEVANAR
mmetsp:Transcript_36875/g.65867  ORF Transcript_36875/g.65867 Transcript_36875/m.65867 type:complete len:87 (-) Transcript_36875:338-598(-)